MIENISIACDAVFGAGSENFGTITGNVTFQDGSANSGTVNGNATFQGTAENKAGATINGDATFASTAVNNGTVSGTVTVEQTDEEAFQAWLAARATGSEHPEGFLEVAEYTGLGSHNGEWYWYMQGPFATEGDAEDARANYPGWLAANIGVNQFTVAGGNPVNPAATHYGQWAYNSTEYASQQDATDAYNESAYQAWLAANTGVNQYQSNDNHNGQWAFNQSEMASQQAAYEAGDEAAYQAWLAANSGVNSFTDIYGTGLHRGQWAFNSTPYGSQAEAEAAANG